MSHNSAGLKELIDYFPGFQVSLGSHSSRGAELAAHDTADLGREAN
jgi:hypothetical protein